ncbi:unnamed protein product [Rotaria sp. Silwood2]|nr:unnamed protein product [Rotaria sp. Silwood2]
MSSCAKPFGFTHERFMSNYNLTIGSGDLSYDFDLTTLTVSYIDINARDHTNENYYLNSYALDFYRHSSKRLLMFENELDRSETF